VGTDILVDSDCCRLCDRAVGRTGGVLVDVR